MNYYFLLFYRGRFVLTRKGDLHKERFDKKEWKGGGCNDNFLFVDCAKGVFNETLNLAQDYYINL